MSSPTPKPYRAICPSCFGQNPRCATCLGTQYVTKHPYAQGAGEQGDDFADLVDRAALDVARRERESGHV